MRLATAHFLVLSLLSTVLSGAQTPGTTAMPAAGGVTFHDLLRAGQRASLVDASGGYYLVVGDRAPSWLATSNQNTALQQALSLRHLLATQYQKMTDANRAVRNAIPPQDVESVKLQLQAADVAVQNAAKQTSRPEWWEIAGVGVDFVSLRSGSTEINLRLATILAVIQESGPPTSASAPPH